MRGLLNFLGRRARLGQENQFGREWVHKRAVFGETQRDPWYVEAKMHLGRTRHAQRETNLNLANSETLAPCGGTILSFNWPWSFGRVMFRGLGFKEARPVENRQPTPEETTRLIIGGSDGLPGNRAGKHLVSKTVSPEKLILHGLKVVNIVVPDKRPLCSREDGSLYKSLKG